MTTSVTTPGADAAIAARRREYGLDWLRVIAFVILIGYHTGMYFVPWKWSVKNPVTSEWLIWPMLFFNRWRLSLLFFISGAGTFFNLRKRGYGLFALERLQRLSIPLAFGIFAICPPQTYVERVLDGQHYTSYWEFWGTVFQLVTPPEGTTTWQHLWFLPYILTYSLLGLPVLALLRSARGRAAVELLAHWCEVPGVIYLLNVPSVTAALILGPRWPSNMNLISDWANFTLYLLAFVWGFVICGSERFLGLIERRRREFLCVATVMAVLMWVVRVPQVVNVFRFLGNARVVTVADSYFALAMIFTLVGWSRAKLNRDSAALRWANTAVYPFYIFHQTITILLGYAWLGWDIPIAVKFPLLFAGTFLGSWALYEVARRTRVTRVLVGMKP